MPSKNVMHNLGKLAVVFIGVSPAWGQALIVASCGTLPTPYSAGQVARVTVDVNGQLCASGGTATLAASANLSEPAAQPNDGAGDKR